MAQQTNLARINARSGYRDERSSSLLAKRGDLVLINVPIDNNPPLKSPGLHHNLAIPANGILGLACEYWSVCNPFELLMQATRGIYGNFIL